MVFNQGSFERPKLMLKLMEIKKYSQFYSQNFIYLDLCSNFYKCAKYTPAQPLMPVRASGSIYR